MTQPQAFQQQLDWLFQGEVQPVLLATDTVWGDEFEVHVVLVDPRDAEPSGYSTYLLLLVNRCPDNPDSPATERTRRHETMGSSPSA